MSQRHHYHLSVVWTGNRGDGTSSVRSFSRDHDVTVADAGTLRGSADPAFRGDPQRWNPEQLFVASLAQCHMLTYLWLAALHDVVVVAYADAATATLLTEPDGSGRIEEVTLHPQVTITSHSDAALANALHDRVGDYCFIARSVAIPVRHEVEVVVEAGRPDPQGGAATGRRDR